MLLEDVHVVEDGVRLLDLLQVDEAADADARHEAVVALVVGHALSQKQRQLVSR